MRAKNVNFVADGLKPNTRIYPFFDKVDVTNFVTPTSASGQSDHQQNVKGGKMFSDGGGSLTGLFQIPDPNVAGNPQFQTGERLFRLTSSNTNAVNPEPETFAHFSLLLVFLEIYKKKFLQQETEELKLLTYLIQELFLIKMQLTKLTENLLVHLEMKMMMKKMKSVEVVVVGVTHSHKLFCQV